METTNNNNPAETGSAPAPAPAAAPAPQPAVKKELPKTDGHTVGGWNRFAGYNPNAPKKQKDGRGDSRGRR